MEEATAMLAAQPPVLSIGTSNQFALPAHKLFPVCAPKGVISTRLLRTDQDGETWQMLLRQLRENTKIPKYPVPPPQPAQEKPLPPLLQWHTELHASDQVQKSGRFAAAVCVDGKCFAGLDLAPGSFVRFAPGLVTLFPRISINIREHHWTGDDQKKFMARHKGAKLPRTKYGRVAKEFSEDHIEVDVEFVLDQLEDFQVTPRTREEIYRQWGGPRRDQRHKSIAVISFTVRPRQQPIVVPAQTRAVTFTENSAQARLLRALTTATRVTMIVDCGEGRLASVFKDWQDICIAARSCGSTADPSDVWWISRDEFFNPDGDAFSAYTNKKDRIQLPLIPWLRGNEDGKTTYQQIYAADQSGKPVRTHWATLQSYADHFTMACLWERDFGMDSHGQQYNMDISYPAVVLRISESEVKFMVRLQSKKLRDLNATGVKMIYPTVSTEVRIHVVGVSRIDKPDTIFDAKAASTPSPDYDISFNAPLPQDFYDGDDKFEDGQKVQIHILWDLVDATSARRIDIMEWLPTGGGPMRQQEGHEGRFNLARIIQQDVTDSSSSNVVTQWQAEHADEELPPQLATLAGQRMNQRQKSFFNSVLTGVRGNFLVLEGYPGSGKTTTMARAIIAAMLLGKKVLNVSQPNRGVEALLESIVAVVDQDPTLHHLRDKIVHTKSEVEENELADQLHSSLPKYSGQFATANWYRMAARIHRYCEAHSDNDIVKHYQAHLKARQEGKEPTSSLPWLTVLTSMRKAILDTAGLLACTTFVARKITHFLFKADMTIVDEAGMTTEPDLMMAIFEHIGHLDLLILVGDPKQLGPVIPSFTSRMNPLGLLLSISPLQRLLEGWNDVPSISLTLNYRGHPSTFAMASHLFYGDTMQPGTSDSDWNTPLAGSILNVLRQRAFSQALDPAALEGNRQFFINVDSNSEREENGVSFFNPKGIKAIVQLVGFLLQGGARRRDIGIITVYSEDKRKMLRALKEQGHDTVDVENEEDLLEASTVDAFQGKEKEIVIVHFVATHAYKHHPQAHPFGFVKDERRLCVATTRARQFQFLVGNLSYWQGWHQAQGQSKMGMDGIIGMMDWVVKKKQVVDWQKVVTPDAGH